MPSGLPREYFACAAAAGERFCGLQLLGFLEFLGSFLGCHFVSPFFGV
jgi:hypothetical protein